MIAGLFVLDLAFGAIRPHAVGFREATAWSVFYVGVAIVFGFVFAGLVGWEYGGRCTSWSRACWTGSSISPPGSRSSSRSSG